MIFAVWLVDCDPCGNVASRLVGFVETVSWQAAEESFPQGLFRSYKAIPVVVETPLAIIKRVEGAVEEADNG